MTNKEKIEVIQAYEDGKVIEIIDEGIWERIPSPGFDFCNCEYRVKPEPIECWVNVYKSFTQFHKSKFLADDNADIERLGEARLMREVTK